MGRVGPPSLGPPSPHVLQRLIDSRAFVPFYLAVPLHGGAPWRSMYHHCWNQQTN